MAQLALLTTTALALAVKAVGNSFLLGVFAHLRRINGVVVLVTAAGDLLNIFAAKLTLLSTAPTALAFDAILHGLCRSQCQHQAEHKSTSHGNEQADEISAKLLGSKNPEPRIAAAV